MRPKSEHHKAFHAEGIYQKTAQSSGYGESEKRHADNFPSAYREIDALLSRRPAQFADLGAAVAAESEDRMPKAFRYYYKDEADKDDMGYLIWTRTGNAWEEKHPSGKDKRFQTAGRDIVEGRPGTVVHWVDSPSLTVFISDKNTDQPQAYYHYGGNEWQILGPMEDVQ